ncbi:MAG: FAD-linked oxidase C-terminal domain-containing protein [Polyangiaceae bacterium]
MSGIESAFAGFQTSTREIDRVTYARDLWPRHHIAVRDGAIAEHKPALVVWPRTTEDVAAIVGVCAREGFSVAPFGAGSGVCGGTLPDPRTVVLDLKKLEAIRAIEGDVLDVEAGANGIRLEEDLVARGHTLGHFPSSILCSTVGGWVAARSAGQCSGLYGKIEDMVVDLECVVGRGEIVRFKRRLSGPDLTPILTGSEGILGVITAARLRIHAAPESRTFVAFSFPTVRAGCDAIRDLFQSGLRPAVSRLYDPFDSWMAKRGRVTGSKEKRADPASKRRSGFAADAKQLALRTLLRAPSVHNEVVERGGDRLFGGTTLVLVFEGTREQGRADLSRARLVAERHRGEDLGESPAKHWFEHRYSVSYRQAPVFMSGAFSDTMEVAAPWSKLEGMYEAVRRAMKRHVFVMAHFSHAYPDGCSIYFTFAGSAPTREEAEAKYDAVWADAMDAVLASGGTLSHHHGVGRSKAPRMGVELGLGVPIVHAMQRVLDPAGVMNPGNLVPREPPRRLAAAPAPRETTFDDESLLAHALGTATLGSIEDAALARGLSLRVRDLDRSETLGAFLARGGVSGLDSYEDPPDHQVAGFVAKLRSGDTLTVRPGPRRAVGPDLYALFHGMNGRVGEVRDAFIRVHRNGLEARALPAAIDRNPPIGRAEGEWIDRVAEAASAARFPD